MFDDHGVGRQVRQMLVPQEDNVPRPCELVHGPLRQPGGLLHDELGADGLFELHGKT